MKQSFPFLFSFLFFFSSSSSWAASCCVSNTNVSNLMILPSSWQETVTLSQSRVIGDVDEKGKSTFRRANNRDVINLAKLDLAYGWSPRYQSGVSVKYQNRSRDFNGENSNSSGWNDLGLSHAYKIFPLERIWVFNNLNIPTAKSQYDARSSFSVDARGTGTYQSSVGVFGISNFREWDFLYSSEVHRSFERTFETQNAKTQVSGFWGTSITGGVGHIPWRSKARYGLGLTPRYEGEKSVTTNGSKTNAKGSLVWDSSINFSYTINSAHSVGLNYTDQTLVGPVRNSLVSRVLSFQFQTKWE